MARLLDMSPQHRQEDRDDPRGRRGHREPASSFLDRREDSEDRGDDARGHDGPEWGRLKLAKGDRLGQEDETTEEQAEADEPLGEPFCRRSQQIRIGTAWIRLEPKTLDERLG